MGTVMPFINLQPEILIIWKYLIHVNNVEEVNFI